MNAFSISSRRLSRRTGPKKALSLQNLNEFELDWKQNYKVSDKLLGKGHFSKVYKVTCKSSGKEYAAKVIRRRRSARDLKDRIYLEADIMLKFSHVDSIICYYKRFEMLTDIVLILEFARGGSLVDAVNQSEQGLSQQYSRVVIYKLLQALSDLHHAQIVHLDIKAENILLRQPFPSTDVALCDFGLAHQLVPNKPHKEISGTPDYMAPETVNYDPISVKTDLWSVGVLVYYCLTKQSPFLADTKDATLHKVTQARIDYCEILLRSEYHQAQQLISQLCVNNSIKRLSADEAMQSQWFHQISSCNNSPEPCKKFTDQSNQFDILNPTDKLPLMELMDQSELNLTSTNEISSVKTRCISLSELTNPNILTNPSIYPCSSIAELPQQQPSDNATLSTSLDQSNYPNEKFVQLNTDDEFSSDLISCNEAQIDFSVELEPSLTSSDNHYDIPMKSNIKSEFNQSEYTSTTSNNNAHKLQQQLNSTTANHNQDDSNKHIAIDFNNNHLHNHNETCQLRLDKTEGAVSEDANFRRYSYFISLTNRYNLMNYCNIL